MNDDLRILGGWTPPDDPGTHADVTARARARLQAHIATASPAPAGPRAPRRRRWWLVAAPPAVALAAAAAVVLSLGSGVQEGHVTPGPATAAQALERAATSAERQPASEVFPSPDQFFYVRSQSTYLNCTQGADRMLCLLATRRREAWLSERRAGQIREHLLGTRWPSAAERRKWVAAGRPDMHAGGGRPSVPDTLAPLRSIQLGNRQLSFAQLRAFDESGATLFRLLRDGVSPGQGPSLYGEVFTQIADALREQVAPPKLRAALYRALKYVPGVHYGGRVRDRLGRPALSVTRTEDGMRRELLFDPVTSAMLQEHEVSVRAGASGIDAPAGTVLADAVYEQRGVVDRVGGRP
jgi:hypothetical protein